MKPQSVGLVMSVATGLVILFASIFCINVINDDTRNYSSSLDTSKILDSVDNVLDNENEKLMLDRSKILSSVATGEIIKGTEEEIKASQQKAIEEATLKAIEEEKKRKVYNNLTLEELSNKINKVFKGSYLANTGELFASYSLEKKVDTYTAVAIVLLETGCYSNCSKQVRTCNNVGGMKGGPSCNGTSYKYFKTKEEGIKSFIDNLSKNYYKQGLDTPEKMNKKYAASSTWAKKVNKYIDIIKKV